MKQQQLIEYNSQTAVVQLPHFKYVDKVLRSTSFEELFWLFMPSPNPVKEISESYAAFSNLKKVCNISNLNWLHIGDGAYARTAAMFAFFSKSYNTSIDPELNYDKLDEWADKYDVERVAIWKTKFQDSTTTNMYLGPPLNPTGVCLVHSHVKVEEVDKWHPNWKFMYTNPCCKPSEQMFTEKYMEANGIKLIVDKLDIGILSHHRRVLIYKKD